MTESGETAFDREALDGVYARVRLRWPKVQVSHAEFARFLADRQAASPASAGWVYADDLYLTCACLLGVPDAFRVLEHEYLRPLFRCSPALPSEEDLLQTVLERLLVPQSDGRPRLASYSGRASLRTWLRVVVKRARLNANRSRQPEDSAVFDDLAERLALPTGGDPELDYLRHRYRHEFARAFRTALHGLDERSCRLLAMYAIRGATGKEIAAEFGVNRVTVVRWLGGIRQSLLHATRTHLERTLCLSRSEFESVVRMLESGLDFGLSALVEPASLHSVGAELQVALTAAGPEA